MNKLHKLIRKIKSMCVLRISKGWAANPDLLVLPQFFLNIFLGILIITFSSASAVVIDPEEVKSIVQKCLTRVKNNIGGWCGTPTVEATYQLTEIGPPVIPHLISALKKEELLEIDNFIIGVLSAITCKDFKIDQPRKALIKEIDAWWQNNHSRNREDWIFDTIQSSNEKEIQLALRNMEHIKNQRYIPKLVSLLKSPKPNVATTALYILWDNFKSQEALNYVKGMLQEGTISQRKTALRFVSDKRISSLSSCIIDVLQSEEDNGVLIEAINTALIISIKESIPILENMDHDRTGKYPKSYIIRALANLKGKEYKNRLLEYLKNGNLEERRGAVENLDMVMDPEDAVQHLLSALKDKDPDVRRYACVTLGRVGSREISIEKLEIIVPILIDLFRQEDKSDLYYLANKALWMIAEKHFSGRPQVDSNLGGSKFARHALSIWEKWWKDKSRQIR